MYQDWVSIYFTTAKGTLFIYSGFWDYNQDSRERGKSTILTAVCLYANSLPAEIHFKHLHVAMG